MNDYDFWVYRAFQRLRRRRLTTLHDQDHPPDSPDETEEDIPPHPFPPMSRQDHWDEYDIPFDLWDLEHEHDL